MLVNWLSAALADGAILFYVFVYTLGLKRRTASNIVIGGAAGCFPVLVGWAAVTGRVSLAAVVLFAMIFFWTPPHFWALAMKFRDDYAAAGVPMLPVVAPASVVARKIVLYSYAMVAATLVLVPYAGWLYGGCAAGLGAWFLAEAHRLRAGVAADDTRAGRPDAALPPVDCLPDPAVRRGGGDGADPVGPLMERLAPGRPVAVPHLAPVAGLACVRGRGLLGHVLAGRLAVSPRDLGQQPELGVHVRVAVVRRDGRPISGPRRSVTRSISAATRSPGPPMAGPGELARGTAAGEAWPGKGGRRPGPVGGGCGATVATAMAGHMPGGAAGPGDREADARAAYLARLSQEVRGHGRWHGLR